MLNVGFALSLLDGERVGVRGEGSEVVS